jgi:predicted nuclease with TOPRIM domain
LQHQVRELDEQLRPLTNHFRAELQSHAQLLSDARAYLANPDDEVALDSAQRTLHELRVRLDEFIKSKARELANQLMIQAEQMERRSAELQPRELEQQVTGAVDFVRHVDDQRRVLEKQFRQLSQKWQQLQQQFTHLHQQAQAAAHPQSLCSVVSARETLEADKQQLDAELEALRPYLTGLQRWREIVLKATALREKLELGSPLRQRLDEETNEAVMENFAARMREALLDWERYKADIDAIEAKINAEENRRRSEFHQNKEKYEQALGQLIQHRMVQATFDSKEPEQSYQVLYQGVLQKLQSWLHEQREFAQRTLDEFEYLIQERGIKASHERDEAQMVLDDFVERACRLNLELVRDLDEFQRYCGELRQTHERLQKVYNSLIRKRAEKEPPTDEEKTLLQTMTTQRCSLEEIRRRLPSDAITLHDLFEGLKELYRKGHIEIEVRKRD